MVFVGKPTDEQYLYVVYQAVLTQILNFTLTLKNVLIYVIDMSDA